eukprot:scaffold501370_cov22-Prasinocladus_malaysianus.AAC.1
MVVVPVVLSCKSAGTAANFRTSIRTATWSGSSSRAEYRIPYRSNVPPRSRCRGTSTRTTSCSLHAPLFDSYGT